MTTYSALTFAVGREAAEALAEAIEALEPEPSGVCVVEIEDGSGHWEVGGYFTEAPDGIGLALLAAAHGAPDFVVSEVPDTDWVAHVQRELVPVVAGRFYLHGSHDQGTAPAGSVKLLIEAAMAFGTGHHGTTLGCLLAIDRMATEGFAPRSVADIGCGTAVLAMAAAAVWPSAAILAADIDPVAVEVAKCNLLVNSFADRILCLEAPGFAHDRLRAARPFDLVLANILKGPLSELAPEMADNIAKNGRAVLSGLLNVQADAAIAAYEQVGFELLARAEIGDWTVLELRRS